MALNNVEYEIINGGLNRIKNDPDSVSAFITDAPIPSSYSDGEKARAYRSLKEVEADGVVASNTNYVLLHYQVKCFFKVAPGVKLYIYFGAELGDPASYSVDFAPITNYEVKQIGIQLRYIDDAWDMVLQAAEELNNNQKSPAVFICGFPVDSGLDIFSTPDLSNYNNKYASIVIAGDDSAETQALTASLGVFIPATGYVLGAVANAKVNESIAWVEKFNFPLSGVKYIGNYTYNTLSLSYKNLLNDKRYLFFRKYPGRAGYYLNDNHTIGPIQENDFAFMNDMRVINKVKRELYKVYLPKLNSPLPVDENTGLLRATLIDVFEGLGRRALNPMQAADEISGYGIYINPDQNVLSNSTLTIEVRIVVNGVARNIVVNLGLTTKLDA